MESACRLSSIIVTLDLSTDKSFLVHNGSLSIYVWYRKGL